MAGRTLALAATERGHSLSRVAVYARQVSPSRSPRPQKSKFCTRSVVLFPSLQGPAVLSFPARPTVQALVASNHWQSSVQGA